MHATTILCVRKGDKVVMMGDGQVSQGSTVVKPNAKKVRRIGEDIIAGFAGSTADCFTLMERLERKLEEHPGQLTRACVDLAKAWRTDKYLRRLEASLLVADKNVSFEITGLGDVLEPKDGVIAIGSGGTFALGKCLQVGEGVVCLRREGVGSCDVEKECRVFCFVRELSARTRGRDEGGG
jgi:ATP-dependent HslUV protease subunit HslV